MCTKGICGQVLINIYPRLTVNQHLDRYFIDKGLIIERINQHLTADAFIAHDPGGLQLLG